MYYAALCGFRSLVENLIAKHPDDIDARGGNYGSAVNAALVKKNVEIAQETEAAYKGKLMKEKELLVSRRQNAMETLAEMGYTAKEPPNLFDAAQLANTRAKRVLEKYETWKKRVTNSLMRTRGLPWER